MVSSGEESDEGGSPRTTVLWAVALSRLRMRPSFIQWSEPPAFRQYLRILAQPSLRSGEESLEGTRHLAPSRLDRARLAFRQFETPTDQQLIARKELVFLQHKRRACAAFERT